MSNVWERFEGIADTNEVAESKNKFSPLPSGTYKMTLEEIAPAESQSGLPMIKGKFRTVDGNRVVFYNQMLQNINYPNMTAVNIAEAVAFVGGLMGEDLEFTGMVEFADKITSMVNGGIFEIEVGYGKNDYDMKFPKLKFVRKVDVQEIPNGIDEPLPFN